MPHFVPNPVLPGFHPDPSILRVGTDYFLATSSFEYFPGVPLFHSRDLAHWTPIGHVLTRKSQLDLRGVIDSGGLWAPSLSHHNGRFYLTVCHVTTRFGPFKDMTVLLFSADDPRGPWSDPITLPSWGFDPSLFHEGDHSYLLNIQWDPRKGHQRFGGIHLQQVNLRTGAPIGERTLLWQKPLLMEGPNLYSRPHPKTGKPVYYLMVAEGGTSWNHAISLARSDSLRGPYTPDPNGPLITSRHAPGLLLQKAGHGELVATPAGEWCLAHLASRPVYPDRRCILGRETCLQRISWRYDSPNDPGWPQLASGTTDPSPTFTIPESLKPAPPTPTPTLDRFESPTPDLHWVSPRQPIDPSWCRTGPQSDGSGGGGQGSRATSSGLTLIGRASVSSYFAHSILLRRLQAAKATATTRLHFTPNHFTQRAGLIVWYSAGKHVYLHASHHESLGKTLTVATMDDFNYDETPPFPISAWPDLHLRAEVNHDKLTLSASPNAHDWHTLLANYDLTKLSDDVGSAASGNFTGTLIGVAAQDLNGENTPAHFPHFELVPQE
jgi:xylan 1,4-beta-xylosidase